MQKKGKFLHAVALFCCLLLFAANAFAKDTDSASAPTGIVLALFGTSDPTAQASIDAFVHKVQAQNPKADVRVAYTAKKARQAQKERGSKGASVSQVLADMAADGIKKVLVQSLHVMPGYEFNDIIEVCKAHEGLPKGLHKIIVNAPLIANAESLPQVSRALLQGLEVQKDETVLFIGHGTHHAGSLAYPALAYALEQSSPRAYVGAIESMPKQEGVINELVQAKTKRVLLLPLMMLAGVHMDEDIAGADDSWAQALRQKGISVRSIKRGLLADPAIDELFLARIQKGLAELQGL